MAKWSMNLWRSIWQTGLSPQSPSAFCFAIVCVAMATGVRMGLGLISPDSAIFAPYYSATLVASLVGGAAAGGLAMVLGGIVAYCLFVVPSLGVGPITLEHLVSLVLYGTSSVVIIWASESYRGLVRRLREEEDRRQLFNDELSHRIKNILANVQAIISQSLRGQEDILEKVSGRVAAFGATNDLLIKSERQSASLKDLLTGEFAPYGLSRIKLEGDEVRCPSNLAISLALVFHELTTNAAKYGALSSSGGRIDIAWTFVAGQLDLQWIEMGGPKVTIPVRKGFGAKLLACGLKQCQGCVETKFESDGLRCRISLAMPSQENPKNRLVNVQRTGFRVDTPSIPHPTA